MKILVAEPLAPAAIELLRAQAGWDIVVADPKTYQPHLADCDALVVRSAVNVDLPAATEAGVLVMNTPGGNAISVAEHTLALMLSMARAVPQANTSTKSG